MSLRPTPSGTVPESTAAVARAVFRRGSPCLRLRDALGPIFMDQQFVALFPSHGQPAEAPWRLALVTLLQFAENLSDRRAADAARSRIDWKYLLGLELADPGFDASVLSEFRSRLVAGGAETLLLDTLLTLCREEKLLVPRGRQRTDSTHVLGAVRALNRLGCAIETMRATLNALAVAAPDWLRLHADPAWTDRYGRPSDDYRIPLGEAARQAYAEGIGRDGHALLATVAAPDAPAWLREVPAVMLLRQVWVQNFCLVPAEAGVQRGTEKPCEDGMLGVVQNGRFMGYSESGQSRANRGIPRFACNPDLNHALICSAGRASRSRLDTAATNRNSSSAPRIPRRCNLVSPASPLRRRTAVQPRASAAWIACRARSAFRRAPGPARLRPPCALLVEASRTCIADARSGSELSRGLWRRRGQGHRVGGDGGGVAQPPSLLSRSSWAVPNRGGPFRPGAWPDTGGRCGNSALADLSRPAQLRDGGAAAQGKGGAGRHSRPAGQHSTTCM